MNKLPYQIMGIGSIGLGGTGLLGNLAAPDVYSIVGCIAYIILGIAIMQLLTKI